MATATAPTMLHNHDIPVGGFAARPSPTSTLTMLPDATAHELAGLFKLLADETRLRILHFLVQEEELNVRTLCGLLDQSQPAVSHHLALLREAGILLCRRDGKHNFYRIVPQRFEAYLETLFGVAPQKSRKLRVANTVVSCVRDGEAAS